MRWEIFGWVNWLFNPIWILMNKEIYFISGSSDEKFRTVHKDAEIPLNPTVLNAQVSARRLWASNQRHLLRQLQLLFCPRECPVWTVPDLRIFGANWCKKGQNSLFMQDCWDAHVDVINGKSGSWIRVASNNSALVVCLNHFNKATVHNARW